MLKHRASVGPAELQWAAPSFRKRQVSANPILVLRSGGHCLSVICKTHNMSTVRLYLWLPFSAGSNPCAKAAEIQGGVYPGTC